MHKATIDSDEISGYCRVALSMLSRPILVCDWDHILFANSAAARLLKAESAEQLIGRSLTELVHPDMRTPDAMRRKLLTESRQPLLGLPAKLYASDGSIVTALTDAHPVEVDGRIVIVYSVAANDLARS
jgi:PAS domain-containing protein